LALGAPKVKEGVPELLFNLASTDRLVLLSEIATRKRRTSDLSKSIGASIPECSRHLGRLAEAGLVKKNPDGLYEATHVGRTILRLLPSMEFVLGNKEYFRSHDLSFLPRGFMERIGELSAGQRVNHFRSVLEHIKTVVSQGREFVWLVSDTLFPQWPGIGSSFHSGEVPVKLISEQYIDHKVVSEYRSRLPRSEIAAMKEVRIAMAINEGLAGVCFPSVEGGIDFSAGFAGTDPLFRTWCTDLFEYYWSKSRKIYSSA